MGVLSLSIIDTELPVLMWVMLLCCCRSWLWYCYCSWQCSICCWFWSCPWQLHYCCLWCCYYKYLSFIIFIVINGDYAVVEIELLLLIMILLLLLAMLLIKVMISFGNLVVCDVVATSINNIAMLLFLFCSCCSQYWWL